MISPRVAQTLRIAFSATCGIAFVLVIALWVRSYSYNDKGSAKLYWRTLSFNSQQGRILIASLVVDGDISIDFRAIPRDDWGHNKWMYEDSRGFVLFRPSIVWLVVSHWYVVLLLAILAVLPWAKQLRYRFSLRTLLVLTTALAVGLGVIVQLTQ